MKHNSKIHFSSFIVTTLFFLGCSFENERTLNTPDIYTNDTTKTAFSNMQKLNTQEEETFILGKSFFSIPWVEAPSATTARDGLGPLFNANTCKSCHQNNSAGIVLNQDATLNHSLVLRLSIAQNIHHDLINTIGFIPEPIYGVQLATNGNIKVPFEGKISVSYEKIKGNYTDGEHFELTMPTYSISHLNYGATSQNLNIAPRLALPLVGLGLLEDISAKDILKNEDVNDLDGDGISGKANKVYSPQHKIMMLGRFAYKATAVDIKHQSANAALNDMGLTNPLYPQENCTQFEKECLNAPKDEAEFDLPIQRLNAISFYLKSLQIPKSRVNKNFLEGEKIFQSLECTKCHISTFVTQTGITIHPYSDLLLHDMGKDLDDGHVDFQANTSEFRTTPLWGIGLREKLSGGLYLLHDGRARSFPEAILWHGGEAQKAKEAFKALEKQSRKYLIDFLKGL